MTTTVPTEIASFAASVRAELADLPAEEVEELTEGLEADLAEAFREDLARELGDPSAYAAELRTAGWSSATRQTISSDISLPRCNSPGGSSQLPTTRSTAPLARLRR